jgi:hypothetical protein
VAHSYNLSYSGGRDKEYFSLKQAQGKSSTDPVLKISNTK